VNGYRELCGVGIAGTGVEEHGKQQGVKERVTNNGELRKMITGS